MGQTFTCRGGCFIGVQRRYTTKVQLGHGRTFVHVVALLVALLCIVQKCTFVHVVALGCMWLQMVACGCTWLHFCALCKSALFVQVVSHGCTFACGVHFYALLNVVHSLAKVVCTFALTCKNVVHSLVVLSLACGVHFMHF